MKKSNHGTWTAIACFACGVAVVVVVGVIASWCGEDDVPNFGFSPQEEGDAS